MVALGRSTVPLQDCSQESGAGGTQVSSARREAKARRAAALSLDEVRLDVFGSSSIVDFGSLRSGGRTWKAGREDAICSRPCWLLQMPARALLNAPASELHHRAVCHQTSRPRAGSRVRLGLRNLLRHGPGQTLEAPASLAAMN